MGIIEVVRDKYPVEAATLAQMLLAVYSYLDGTIPLKIMLGLIVQAVAIALLGRKQTINEDNSKGRSEAIISNQVAIAAATPGVNVDAAVSLMAPKSATSLVNATLATGETQVPK